jgi:protein-disulfide isomerase
MYPQAPLSHLSPRHNPTTVGVKILRTNKFLKQLGSCFLFFTLLICATEALAQSGKTVVAKIGDRVITQQEVDDTIAEQLRPLEEQIYALRKAALDNMIARGLLEDEAKKRGISVDDLKKEFTSGKVDVPQAQLDKAYAENANVFGSMSPDEARERVRLDLESQIRIQKYKDAVGQLGIARKVEVLLAAPKVTVKTGDMAEAASIGDSGAPITIVEFSDFQCPFCRESQPTIKNILQTYSHRVRLVFRHLPLEMHANAFASAQAAVCANEQGSFWKYHDALFSTNDLSDKGLNRIAQTIGLDTSKFDQCMTSDKSREIVRKDMEEAQRLGINSTPTFIVNGSLIRGAISFNEFRAVVDRELKSHP